MPKRVNWSLHVGVVQRISQASAVLIQLVKMMQFFTKTKTVLSKKVSIQ